MRGDPSGPLSALDNEVRPYSTLVELLSHRAQKQPLDVAYIFLKDGEHEKESLEALWKILIRCDEDSKVELVVARGAGHTWPSGWQYLPQSMVGRTSRDIDASIAAWRFFQSTL